MIIEGRGPNNAPQSIATDNAGRMLAAVQSVGASATAAVSRVAASATAVTLLAANAERKRVVIYNDSTADLFVKFGTAATATDFTYKIGPGDTYEAPTDWVYTGIVTGAWSAAVGAAQVTEV